MTIRSFLLFVVLLSAMLQGPAQYLDLTCVEPEPGYGRRVFHYFTATEIEKVCPTSADLTWRIGKEIFCTLLCVLLMLLLDYVPSIANGAKVRWPAMVSLVREWINRPSRCRHCGTAPCQVKWKCLWKTKGFRKRDSANFVERSKAMMVFNYGLSISVELTKELPLDDLFLERWFCQRFEEEHMVLFPQCIQRHINYWYPVPR
ncbi:uncharacterized protein LOC110458353 [Mizuhopecten yessoensis]|uniref:uncharacterized protein LOC110458353 n=1 Tax=Mizuhopecten yessoensis TaxID=6573 RepID=UPI000B459474|nr:uncharacterized protein LOC110458353 [Mizuhopecten yessoensis]